MSTQELVAGRELDARIAKKVMGLPECHKRFIKFTISGVQNSWDCPVHGPQGCIFPSYTPSYSTDIAAAWQVVEKLLSTTPQGGDIHIEKLGGAGWKVGCCFNQSEGGWDGWIEAETAPLAICRAALAAMTGQPRP